MNLRMRAMALFLAALTATACGGGGGESGRGGSVEPDPQLLCIGPIFQGPAAITHGRPPMFEPGDIVVAERGLLGEGNSDYGNALSVFRRRQP